MKLCEIYADSEALNSVLVVSDQDRGTIISFIYQYFDRGQGHAGDMIPVSDQGRSFF